jgi:transposase
MKDIRYLGLDADSEKIAVAVADPGGEVRSLGTIPYREDSLRRLVKKLGPASRLRACYEAGPHGYSLYWQLNKLGVHYDVVAPTLVPVKSGDRVKTNRRDAEKLARCHRSGDLTAVWVPDAAHEALRDLVRAREAARKDQLRARHRLGACAPPPGEVSPAPRSPRGGGGEELDDEAPPVGQDTSIRAPSPGGDFPRLLARGRARGAESNAARSGH